MASGLGQEYPAFDAGGFGYPSQGTVRVQGQDILPWMKMRAALARAKNWFVFQSFQLLPNLTALESVMLPLGWRALRYAQQAHSTQRVGLEQRLYTTQKAAVRRKRR